MIALAAGAGGLLAAAGPAKAVFYQGTDGQVVFEAERFQQRTPAPSPGAEAWRVRNTDSDGTTNFQSASGGSYIQATPDDGSNPMDLPTTSYDFRIGDENNGDFFNFFGRVGGPNGSGDSANADLFSVADDGTETLISQTTSGGFASGGGGNFEYDTAGLNGTLQSNTLYRLRNIEREDGAAVDQFVATTGSLQRDQGPLSPSPLVTGTTTLENSDTTFLQEQHPNRNVGGLTRVRTIASVQNSETLLTRFPDIASRVDEGQTVVSATLRLYKYSQKTEPEAGLSTTAEVHRVLKSWVEGSGTPGDDTFTGASYNWRDEYAGKRWQGGGGSELGEDVVGKPTDVITIDGSEGESGYQEWDVTEDVQRYLAATAENHGWLIHENSPSVGPFFYTEEANGLPQPQLVLQTSGLQTSAVQSTATNPEPTTAALLGLGGGMLLLGRRRGGE